MFVCDVHTGAMRPIPHTEREGEETGERARLTTRSQPDEEPDDDETWLDVQEF